MEPIPNVVSITYFLENLLRYFSVQHVVYVAELILNHKRFFNDDKTKSWWDLLEFVVLDVPGFVVAGKTLIQVPKPSNELINHIISRCTATQLDNFLAVLAICEGFPTGLPRDYFSNNPVTIEAPNSPHKLQTVLKLGSSPDIATYCPIVALLQQNYMYKIEKLKTLLFYGVNVTLESGYVKKKFWHNILREHPMLS